MQIQILDTPVALGRSAAAHAATLLREAIARRGYANLVLATGSSQFEVLKNLVAEKDIRWSAVTMFHLDEYIGLDASHPASFRQYLRTRFVEKAAPLRAVHFIEADADDPARECRRLNLLIRDYPIDVSLIGIGENGHLAFNDPPADFRTEDPFIIVDLDEACRRQQLGEGWFASMEDIPHQAISMSIRQILKSRHLIVSVPDARKAHAVQCAVEGPLTPQCPASILREHPHCMLFLDRASASRLGDAGC